MDPTSHPEKKASHPDRASSFRTPLVRAAALIEFPALVRELGGHPEPLLFGAGLSLLDLTDPEKMVPAAAMDQLLTNGAADTGCAHFGLLLAQRHDLATYMGTLGRVVWASADLGTALTRFTSHLEAHAQGSRWTLDTDGQLTRLRNDLAAPSSIQALGHNLLLLTRLVRSLTGRRSLPSMVYFTASAPIDSHSYRRLFRTPVLFGQEANSLVLHTADLRLPLPTADRQLSEILLRHQDLVPENDEPNLVENVEALIERNLLSGVHSIEAVARFLPYSRATLQQRLSDLDTSHQQILDQVRDRWAKERLATSSITIAELAHTLGFARADTFAAAFKRHNGMAPTRWRAANTAQI